jgi:tetratricopeptide (TPR) repeat protein
MRQSRANFCVFLGSLALAAASALAQPDAQFAKANQEYASGHFSEAIDGYQGLVRAGEWSANLFYDLGNAYFRNKDFGRAILNYERALALEPHHPEAQANLRIARDEVRALELQPTRAERYLQFATLDQYTTAAAVVFWLAAFSITGLILSRQRSSRLISISIISFALFVILMAAIFWLDRAGKGRALAIVIGRDTEARVATADNANRVLALPPGSEIKVVQQRGDWLYATLPNNLNGWIPAKSAELVRL